MTDRKSNHSLVREYVQRITSTLQEVLLHDPNLEQAAEAVAHSLAEGGVLHIRAPAIPTCWLKKPFTGRGGLVQVDAILDTGLMLHESPIKSTHFERLPGYA